jgi:hypothetical protein
MVYLFEQGIPILKENLLHSLPLFDVCLAHLKLNDVQSIVELLKQ